MFVVSHSVTYDCCLTSQPVVVLVMPFLIVLKLWCVFNNYHWHASVLYKRFLTPFRDDIWNRRLVSVGDRGVHPTRPRKPSGICPPGTHARQNEVMCGRRVPKYGNTYSRAKNIIIWRNCFQSQVHPTQSVPAKSFVRMYIPQSRSKENVSVHRYITHNFPR